MALLGRAGSFHSPTVPYQQTNPNGAVSYLGYSTPALFTPSCLPPYFLLLPSSLLPTFLLTTFYFPPYYFLLPSLLLTTSLLTPPSLSFRISFS